MRLAKTSVMFWLDILVGPILVAQSAFFLENIIEKKYFMLILFYFQTEAAEKRAEILLAERVRNTRIYCVYAIR
jgi:hypothetical protein